MILRRVIEHVKAQAWTAIALDFLIVVTGVFIGIQLGNWNDARRNQADFDRALERYRAEIETNLETLDVADAQVGEALRVVGAGFDALQSCEETPENLALIEAGLSKMMGTSGLDLHKSALSDLNEAPALKALQSPADREQFSNTLHRMEIFLREARAIEYIPLEERAQNNPIIAISETGDREVRYFGVDYSRRERSLTLAVPIDVACKDNMLVKSFYTWERWQGALPAVSRVLREQLEADLAYLAARK